MTGPLFDDLSVGVTIPPLPAVTLTEADNVAYRAITGDQHRLAADVIAYRAVGGRGVLANPALVMQYAIGQTTNATRRAIANLYYRSVRILRPVEVGETLTTTTTVLGLRDATPKDGQHRGKVWLGIRAVTEQGPVIEMERCALLPARGPCGHDGGIPGPGAVAPLDDLAGLCPAWDLGLLPATSWALGETRLDPLRDLVDMAPALARMTFNQAAVHRDATLGPAGRRLVYGGHVQGLAQASLTRVLPGLAMVLAWDGCDHLAPAFEGDLVEFGHHLVEESPAGGGRLLRFVTTGTRLSDGPVDILRWTPVVWAP